MSKKTKILGLCLLLAALGGILLWTVLHGRSQTDIDGDKALSQAGDATASALEQLEHAETLLRDAESPSGKNETVDIRLSDDGITAPASVSIDQGILTITAPGTYTLTGSLSNGQVNVDCEGEVTLILSGVSVTDAEGPAISIQSAEHVLVYLKENTENTLISGIPCDISTVDTSSDEATGAALHSKVSLSIAGEGTLHVYGYINNGIATTDHLVLLGGSLNVTAAHHGLKGKDSVSMEGGDISILSGTDGIHSEGTITISGGTLVADAGDDGVHADQVLTVSGGEITITRSTEGLEAEKVYLTGGDININASDDGVNASGGDSSGDVMPGPFSSASTDALIQIDGGTIYIQANGDGIDSNGDLIINGGYLVVDGPQGGGDSALDAATESNGVLVCNGGTVLAIGSSGMASCFSDTSAQISIHKIFNSLPAGTQIIITNGAGEVLMEHTAVKVFSSVLFSSPSLQEGDTVTITAGEETATVDITGITNGDAGSSFGGNMGGFGAGGFGNGGFGGQGGPGMGGFGGFGGQGNQSTMPTPPNMDDSGNMQPPANQEEPDAVSGATSTGGKK
ncbi:MAG: carbohydrate-binding domain-containing protein [Lachnospiraceae bacterium]|nr:carbohydrate-binding domain-containing protein [Lachnospiraceae bacterium]